MAPVVHGLEAEYGDRIRFVYLDIDDPNTRKFQQALHFRVQPQFLLLDPEGNVVKEWVGFVEREEFVRAFEAVLK